MAVEVIPEGMVPWAGGNSAPADWDGGPVLFRKGSIQSGTGSSWSHPWDAGVDGASTASNSTNPFDIIAYTPRSTPIPEQPAPVAGVERIKKALETPYTGGIWEGSSVCEKPFVTIREEDLRALLAAIQRPAAPSEVEAMREAAALVCKRYAEAPVHVGRDVDPAVVPAQNRTALYLERTIRALPVEPSATGPTAGSVFGVEGEVVRRRAIFLAALTEAGIPADTLDMLISGVPTLGIQPGALNKAIASLSSASHSAAGELERVAKAINRANWNSDAAADERWQDKLIRDIMFNQARAALAALSDQSADAIRKGIAS